MSQTTNTTRNFIRHYGEMVLAMYAGMAVPGVLLGATTRDSAPALFALVMAVSMTAPMALWMRYRGHPWRDVIEMAAVMAGCALAAILLVWLSVIPAAGICAIECGLMLPAMLGAMLVRRAEWTGGRRPAGFRDPAADALRARPARSARRRSRARAGA